jgi:hypothetical protein
LILDKTNLDKSKRAASVKAGPNLQTPRAGKLVAAFAFGKAQSGCKI